MIKFALLVALGVLLVFIGRSKGTQNAESGNDESGKNT
jgi:hypothetical protein